MSDLIFAPAWWMLVAAFLAAGFLWFLGNNRLDKVLMRTGLAVAALTVVWGVVGYLVETPREAASDGTKSFVNAVVARDPLKMGEYLAPTATLGMLTKTDILKAGPLYADRWGLKSALITSSELEERGTQLNCTITVISQHEGSDARPTMKSDWTFTWGQTSEGWRIVQIAPVRIGSEDVESLTRKYFTEKP